MLKRLNAGGLRVRLWWIVAGAGVVIFGLGLAVVSGWGFYYRHASGAFARRVATTFELPAGRVGKRVVLYRDYLRSRDGVMRFASSTAAAEQKLQFPAPSVLEKNVLEKLMTDAAVEDLADQKKVTVSDEELRKYFADVVTVAASSTGSDVGVYLLKNYGWNEEDFRQLVLRPALLQQRLSAALSAQAEGDPNALTQAVNARLKQNDVVRYMRF